MFNVIERYYVSDFKLCSGLVQVRPPLTLHCTSLQLMVRIRTVSNRIEGFELAAFLYRFWLFSSLVFFLFSTLSDSIWVQHRSYTRSSSGSALWPLCLLRDSVCWLPPLHHFLFVPSYLSHLAFFSFPFLSFPCLSPLFSSLRLLLLPSPVTIGSGNTPPPACTIQCLRKHLNVK